MCGSTNNSVNCTVPLFPKFILKGVFENVCMESTGKYYIPVYNVLERHISNIVVANPKWVRCIKGEKDDNNVHRKL